MTHINFAHCAELISISYSITQKQKNSTNSSNFNRVKSLNYTQSLDFFRIANSNFTHKPNEFK